MKAFVSHFSFEFFAGLRNRSLLLMNYLMPIGFYFFAGAIMIEINPFLLDQIIPAMVIFAVLTSTTMGLPSPLIEARENEILRSYRINGVPASSLLTIPSLSTAVHIIAVACIITITAPIIFKGQLPENWLAYLLVFITFLFASTGLGSLIGVISGNSRIAVLFQQMVYLPSMLIGGLMIPTEILPTVFARIAHLLPATYGMQAFLGLAYGQETLYNPWLAALILTLGGVAAYTVSTYLFTWDTKNSTKGKHPALAVLALVPYILGALLLF